MKNPKKIVAFLALFLLFLTEANAGIARNTKSGYTNPNLQDVINRAENGAIIEVSGIFEGHFNNDEKTITLYGNPAATLDGQSTGIVFQVNSSPLLPVTVKLIDLIIQNGHVEGSGAGIQNGGVMAVDNTVYIKNCIIQNNVATLNEEDNTSGYGGAVASTGPLYVDSSSIINNTAAYGGAVALNNTYIASISNSKISGNRATGGCGGAIYFYNSDTLTLTNVNIKDNQSIGEYSYGGGLYVNSAYCNLIDCRISKNVSQHGGGLYAHQSEVVINRSSFRKNIAYYGGGTYVDWGSSVIFRDSTIQKNSARTQGGGIYGREVDLSEGNILKENLPDDLYSNSSIPI